MSTFKFAIQSTLLIGLSCLLIACSNPKVTRANYHLVDIGMHLSEVTQILGEPDWCDQPRRPNECRWGDEDKNIEIIFVARRVVDKRATGLGHTR